ncbi:unnamed protein product [Brassica oleracea]
MVRGTADHPEGNIERRTCEAGSASPGPAIASNDVHSRRCYLKKLSGHTLRILTDVKNWYMKQRWSTGWWKQRFNGWTLVPPREQSTRDSSNRTPREAEDDDQLPSEA